jgi:ribosomal protein S18 acetylase RimI-like enzyme
MTDQAEYFRIREATPKDIPELADLHVQTFIETHGGVTPPGLELRNRQWCEAFQVVDGSWFCLVIEAPSGELLGFAKGTLHDGGVPGFVGELNKIYILRRHQGRGLGRRLVGHVARRFLLQGINSMLLFGDSNNPSNGFYEALGAEKLFSAKGEFHGGYGWRDLQSLAKTCPD